MALVDMGTSKIALTIAKIQGDNTEVLYYRECPSEGIRYGSVVNPMKAGGRLKEALAQAEEELNIKITQVVIGMPRSSVKQESIPGQIIRPDSFSCITQEEVDSLKNIALDDYPLDDSQREEIYGSIAQSFTADDMIHASEEDIVGIPSEKLEGNFKVFVGPKRPVDNIYHMLNRLGVGVARRFFTPEAVGKAILTRDESENGVGVIDFGAGVTSVSIFQGGILRYYSSIPFGGKTITSDIKYECGVREVLAENIKLAFGACLPDKLQTLADKIIQINNDEDGSYQQLPVKYLSEIITSRVHEIFQAILFLIQQSGYADKLRCGLVITGGSANLVNCANMLKDESGYTVRVGAPRTRHFSADSHVDMNRLSAATSAGLLLLAREDEHLNCVESAAGTKPEAAEEVPETEPDDIPEEKTEQGRDIDDMLSDLMPKGRGSQKPAPQPAIGKIQKPVREPEPEKKQAQSKREARKEEKKEPEAVKRVIIWGKKLKDVLEGAFDTTLGDNYDNMR